MLECQRQPAQLIGQLQRCLPVRITGAVTQEVRCDLPVQDGHVQDLAGRPERVSAGDQHSSGPGRWQEPLDRCPVRRVVKDQQPPGRAGGQHPVHRGHRIPTISSAKLGGQLTEPGRQHRWVLGRKLPHRPDLVQVPVRVLQRHAGLAHPAQAAQHHHPRPLRVGPGEPVTQVGEQRLPADQVRWLRQ